MSRNSDALNDYERKIGADRAALVEKALDAYCLRHDTTGKMRPAMEAAVSIIRNEVLEEAARVADDHVFGGAGVAAAIRALKGSS